MDRCAGVFDEDQDRRRFELHKDATLFAVLDDAAAIAGYGVVRRTFTDARQAHAWVHRVRPQH
jgi:hypothetical protein